MHSLLWAGLTRQPHRAQSDGTGFCFDRPGTMKAGDGSRTAGELPVFFSDCERQLLALPATPFVDLVMALAFSVGLRARTALPAFHISESPISASFFSRNCL